METAWDTWSWRPQKDSRIWVYTIEAEDCESGATCKGHERKRVPHSTQAAAVSATFGSKDELLEELDSFVEYQNAVWASGKLRPHDSVVLQLSSHGKDFAHLDANGEIIELHDCIMRLNLKLRPATVLLINQCWGGWPRWGELFRKRDGSPRFIFGTIKRYETLQAALNSAEGCAFRWLRGNTVDQFPTLHSLMDHIHKNVFTEHPEHADLYRVWHWRDGKKMAYPPAEGKRLGVPD